VNSEAARVIERLALEPHPEGGYYREIYRAPQGVRTLDGRELERSASTAVYYVLADDDFSAFNRVQGSDEVWHLYAGGPVELHIIGEGGGHTVLLLASDLERGEPVAVVPAGTWQAARLAPGAEWAFCGCTVAPGFEFADFEVTPAGALLAAHPEHAELISALTRS
jgi:predicted cupin superfamily sugar epimerase